MEHMGGEEDAGIKKKMEEMSEELKEKIEEMDGLEALNQTLVVKERMSNDELQDARKELIYGLDDMLSSCSTIGIKRMGELDEKIFLNICKRKYAKDDADMKAAELCSMWQEQLKNPSWHPFKVVTTGKKSQCIQSLTLTLLHLLCFYGGVIIASCIKLQYKDPKAAGGAESAVQKAKDVVSSMLAKGFILGKDAARKAKAFDKKHQFTSTATACIDKNIGLSEKIAMGTSAIYEKAKGLDQKFEVSEKTKPAFAAAEQVSSAGSAIMENRCVFTGALLVIGASKKVASDVWSKTKGKVWSVISPTFTSRRLQKLHLVSIRPCRYLPKD